GRRVIQACDTLGQWTEEDATEWGRLHSGSGARIGVERGAVLEHLVAAHDQLAQARADGPHPRLAGLDEALKKRLEEGVEADRRQRGPVQRRAQPRVAPLRRSGAPGRSRRGARPPPAGEQRRAARKKGSSEGFSLDRSCWGADLIPCHHSAPARTLIRLS